MDFKETGLPDKELFRDAFAAGWARYLASHDDDRGVAMEAYVRGPVAMARLISSHGGECHQIAAAACLAGPSLFSLHPADRLNKRLVEFSSEIKSAGDHGTKGFASIIPGLSGDARLFLQASAIMLLEHEQTDEKDYHEAMTLYSAARGGVDAFNLDTRFEIAAMKATSMMGNQPHVWAKAAQKFSASVRI